MAECGENLRKYSGVTGTNRSKRGLLDMGKRGKEKIGFGKNIVFNIIKTLSSILFPLITVPYISRILQAEYVGRINFGGSIVGYISLIASLGVSTYAIRECSRVRGDRKKLGNTASQIMSINLFSTMFAYAVLAVLLLFWDSLKGYRELIMIQSTVVLFNTLGTDWLNSAMEDFRYLAFRTFLFQLLSLAVMFLFIHGPEDYLKYACISVLAGSGANITNMIYRRKFCRVRMTAHIDWKKHLPPILLLFAMILAQTIFVNVDTTMLGLMKGDREVGLYSIATKVYTLVNQVIASIAWVVMPRLSGLFLNRDYKEINKVLRYVANVICVLGIPSVIGLNLLAPEIIEIIAGTGYMEAVPALHILTAALAFSLMGGFVGNIILLPSGRENVCLMSCLAGAAVNFITNMLWIPACGKNAAAFTTALSQAVVLVISVFFIEKNIKLYRVKDILAGPLAGGILIVVLALPAKLWIQNVTARTITILAVSACSYAAALLLLHNELAVAWRNKAIDLYQRIIKKRKAPETGRK